MAWFSEIVKFRQHYNYIAMGEDCKIRDQDVLSALAEAWSKGAKKFHPYRDTLQTLVRAKDDNSQWNKES